MRGVRGKVDLERYNAVHLPRRLGESTVTFGNVGGDGK
jgi:hypothetical protein